MTAAQQQPDYARAWASMRILRRFTARDICTTAEISIDYVRRYLMALKANGYTRQVAREDGYYVYQLVRNTGPKAPTLTKVIVLRDPNTGEEFPASGR